MFSQTYIIRETRIKLRLMILSTGRPIVVTSPEGNKMGTTTIKR